ncbi:hypothetical protein ACFW04_013835 [Cataglyphis niger]
MFEHFVLQLQLQRSIESFLENFKKIGRSNLTPTKVRSRMSTLKETWIQFCNGHTEISQRIPEATRSSFTYFKENHFESTYAAYNNAFDHMIEILEELEPIISPNSSLSSTRLLAHAALKNALSNCSEPQTSESTPEVNSLIASTKNPSGHTAVIRALLDQGSEMIFISEKLAQILHTKRIRIPISVSSSISYTPRQNMDLSSFSYLSDLPRVDADPTSLDPINLIIEADLYNDIILEGCEEHFRLLHSLSDERYVVRLQFKKGPLIESEIQNFGWKKYKPKVAKEYREFMFDYQRLGHMQPAPKAQNQIDQHVYLPHHGVIRESSFTTRLRAVFNASSIMTYGIFLND